MRFFIAVLSLSSVLTLAAASPEQDIRAVLERQSAAWNRGDIQAFMQDYSDSPDVAFIGKELVRGKQEVLERYLRQYPDRARMGTLTFSAIEVRLLNGEWASVIGRFALARDAAAGGPADGIFNLLFQKTPKGWKILLDHTS